MTDLMQRIADELKLKRTQVEGAVALLDAGYAVPFVARYRKDRTGGLDDAKIRAVRARWEQLNELEKRRAVVLKAVADAGKMTPSLQAAVENTSSRTELEDLYMPFRARRRLRSTAAKQKGLEGLADLIWKQLSPADAVPPVPDAAPPAPATETASTAAAPVAAEQKPDSTAPAAETAAPPAPVAETANTAAAAVAPPAPAPKPPTTSKAEELVKPFINAAKGVKDMADALAGARDIVAERIAEDAVCRKLARDLFHSDGRFTTKAREGVDLSKGKYAAFAGVSEPLSRVSAHRLLLALRGAAEKQLTVALEPPREKILQELKARTLMNPDAILRPELVLGVEECFDRLLGPALDNELRQELKRRADQEVIATCARNLRALLLQPPLGPKPVLAIDPAPGVGLKIAVLDATGKLVAHAILSPEKGAEERKAAAATLATHIKEHGIKSVALGDGTGSRETDLFVRDVMKTHELQDVRTIVVRLHGASQVGREDLDVEPAARGAVALGRYLQDPLPELVRLDPTTISVGQHQHEVDQGHLRQKLEEVLESCVCEIGADANTAGAALLRHIAGLNLALATALAETRKAKGPYKSREELRELPGAEPRTFEQCAGFVRVSGSANPLDATAVHPEAYSVVDAMAASVNSAVKNLIGNAELLGKLDLSKLKTEQCGDFTLRDIVEELKHPAKDVRGDYVVPEFNPDVREITDLKEGMLLSGLVTNLTAFGAFVDIGVHQDGLVHISAITRKFIRDASEVLSVGQRVKVKVLSADVDRKRISLSMKELEPPPPPRREPRRATTLRPASGPAGTAAAPAGTEQAGQAKPAVERRAGADGPRRREFRPRPPRPSPAQQPAAQTSATPAPAGDMFAVERVPGSPPPAGATASAAPVGGALSPAPAGVGPESRPRRFGDKPGGDRHGRGDASGGPGGSRDKRGGERDRGDRHSRTPAKPVEPGKPDYSKFFVKSKRKEHEKKRGFRAPDGASRDEIRQVLKKQESGGTTLGDLLRQAGVAPDENK